MRAAKNELLKGQGVTEGCHCPPKRGRLPIISIRGIDGRMMFIWPKNVTGRQKETSVSEDAKITALDERLSHDDELQGESSSTASQKMLLESCARKNGFLNLRHRQNDGISGVHFKRLAFQEMMAEAEAGMPGRSSQRT